MRSSMQEATGRTSGRRGEDRERNQGACGWFAGRCETKRAGDDVCASSHLVFVFCCLAAVLAFIRACPGGGARSERGTRARAGGLLGGARRRGPETTFARRLTSSSSSVVSPMSLVWQAGRGRREEPGRIGLTDSSTPPVPLLYHTGHCVETDHRSAQETCPGVPSRTYVPVRTVAWRRSEGQRGQRTTVSNKELLGRRIRLLRLRGLGSTPCTVFTAASSVGFGSAGDADIAQMYLTYSSMNTHLAAWHQPQA